MAIDPKLVSIKQASDLPSAIPTNAGEFLFFEDNTLQKSPMSDIYDRLNNGINGAATESNAPNMGTGFFRYIVTEPITTGSAWGIAVTQAELDDNWVFFNVTDGVITKDSKPNLSGIGISSITKTSTAGEVDTYTITYSDATTSTFTVTNGKIQNDIINVTAEYPLTAGNYYTFSTATAAVPSNRRTAGAIVTYQTAVDNWETAKFTGTVIQWAEKARWVIEKITHSKINLVTSNAIESTRRTIRAKVEAGKSYMVSNKLTFDGLYTSGYYNASGVKLGEINFNNFAVQFDPVTSRYYKLLGNKAPVNAVEISIVFGADTDNTEFMVEEAKTPLPSYYEHPVLKSEYVRKEVNDLALSKKVENISQLPETVISSKNLYNPYTRVQIGTRLGRNVYMSDFIEVEEGAKYYLTRPDSGNSYFYDVFDANKVLTRSVLYPYVTIGVGEKYVKLHQAATGSSTEAQLDNYASLASPIQFEKSVIPTYYEPRFQLADYVLKNSVAKKYRSTLQGKVCYYLGDSITNGGAWTSVVHSELGFGNTADRGGNLGRDGSQWTDTLNSGVSTNNNIKDRIDALEIAITALGVPPDVIIIALGTNDWGNNKPVGDYATAMAKNYADVAARTTVFDAVKYGVTRLKKLYPNAFIVINTPIQRAGKYDTIYVDAIKDAAKMMSTPVIDVYAKSGVVPYDEWLTTYYSDGLHITSAGGVQVGRYVANELLNLYYKK